MSDDDTQEKSKQKHTSEELAVQNIMRTEGGRNFIWGQLQSCGTFESIFDINSAQSSYNSGMRDAGLRLNRVVKEAAPEYYIKMIQENLN
jgi:hypothetical protein